MVSRLMIDVVTLAYGFCEFSTTVTRERRKPEEALMISHKSWPNGQKWLAWLGKFVYYSRITIGLPVLR